MNTLVDQPLDHRTEEQNPQVRRLAILGLGLIGGSLALAAKKNHLVTEVVAWGRSESSLQAGLELGAIDHYSLELEPVIQGADVIVLATPVLTAEQMLIDLFKKYQTKAIVTDVSSTKNNFLTTLRQALGEIPPNLVLGHPIAGAETSGIGSAKAHLFEHHRVILTPTSETSEHAFSVVQALWQGVGAEVVSMSAEQHDLVLAATSHLPHILAYALVDALSCMENDQEVFRFAAGGFRDFTRIAKSSPAMWHDIALANQTSLLQSIDKFSLHLETLRDAIETKNSQKLLAILEHVSTTRKNLHTAVLPKKSTQ